MTKVRVAVLMMWVVSGTWAFGGVDPDPSTRTVQAGNSPRGLAVGDVFGGGVQSLVVANFGAKTFIGQTTPVSLLDPSGSSLQVFSPSPSGLQLAATIPTASSPRGVVLTHLSGQGPMDILTTAYGSDLLQVFSWRNGRFVLSAEEATLKMPVGLAAGTTKAGGAMFVAVADFGADRLSIFPVVNGHLGKRTDIQVDKGPTQVAVGDLNGDGQNEIIVACLPSNKIDILSVPGSNRSDATAYTVTKTLSLPEGGAPSDLRVTDLNADGRADLVVADYSRNAVVVFLQQAAGELAPQPSLATSGSHPNGLTVADLTGPGSREIIVADRDTDSIDIFGSVKGQYRLSATLRLTEEPSTPFGPVEIGVMDTTGNGKKDLVTSHMRSDSLKVVGSALAGTGAVNAAAGNADPVLEPTGTPTEAPAAVDKSFRLGANSFDILAGPPLAISYLLDAAGRSGVQVYAASGQVVRHLTDPSPALGPHQLEWDGRDDDGRPVFTGVYLLVLVRPDGTDSRKVLAVHR